MTQHLLSRSLKASTLFLLALFTNIFIAYGQFTFGTDNASNVAYGSGFGDGQNGGSGFGPWNIAYGSNTGSYKGNPSDDGMGTTGIGTEAFAFYATGSGYLNASRSFEALQFNDVLFFYWAMNWDANSGNKGFDLKSGSTTIFNVNNAGSQTINTSNGTADSGYGTKPMLVSIKRSSTFTYEFSMSSRSGGPVYTTTINSSASIDGIEIYIGGQNDGSGQRNIYFNHFNVENDGNFNVTAEPITYARDLTGTGALTKTGIADLILTGTNTYSGTTTINGGILQLPSGLPNSDVIVNNGGTLVIIGNATLIKSLSVDAGGTTVVDPGKSLIATTVNNNGSITLESDSTTYSSLLTDAYSGSGIVNYNRHVNQNASSGGNDLIASPVSGETFGMFAASNSNLVQDPNNINRKLFGPFDKTSGEFLIYDTTVHGGTTIESGLGYRSATTDNGTLAFSGALNTGTVNQNISVSGPQYALWNLIGNPYSSYLYVKEDSGVHPGFLSENASELDENFVAIYGYDDDDSDGDIYTIWNLANTTSSTVITPGQGFFVASKVGGGTVSFTPNMRTLGTSDDFILGRTASENSGHLKLKISNTTKNYSTEFYFNEISTLGLDPGYDAGVFGGVPPVFSLCSQLVENNDNAPMALQSLPYSVIETDVSIPLGVKAAQGQQLTFSLNENTLPTDTNVYLEDRMNLTTTLLNASNYILDANTALSGFGRFYLRFTDSTLSNGTNSMDNITIFYSPFPNTLTVRGTLSNGTSLNLYDLQGRLVLSSPLDASSDDNRIDVPNISNGIYVVTLNDGQSHKTQKIVIR